MITVSMIPYKALIVPSISCEQNLKIKRDHGPWPPEGGESDPIISCLG